MIWSIVAILVILWMLGFMAHLFASVWIHALLVIAIGVIIFGLIQGRSK